MNNLELLVLCALRQMFYREELEKEYLDKVQLTSAAKRVALNDVDSMFSFKEYNKDVDLKELVEGFPEVEQIELDTNSLNYFYLKAILYSLGRETYIVGVALEWTEEYLDELSSLTKERVTEILDEYLKTNKRGFYNNVTWKQIRDLLSK